MTDKELNVYDLDMRISILEKELKSLRGIVFMSMKRKKENT